MARFSTRKRGSDLTAEINITNASTSADQNSTIILGRGRKKMLNWGLFKTKIGEYFSKGAVPSTTSPAAPSAPPRDSSSSSPCPLNSRNLGEKSLPENQTRNKPSQLLQSASPPTQPAPHSPQSRPGAQSSPTHPTQPTQQGLPARTCTRSSQSPQHIAPTLRCTSSPQPIPTTSTCSTQPSQHSTPARPCTQSLQPSAN